MTQTAQQRPAQQELESIHAQMVRSRNGIDMNADGARLAYQHAVPVLFEEIVWLRQQYATAHATLAQGVPVESEDQTDLVRLTAAVVALWKAQEQGLYAKPAMAKLKEQNDDLRNQIRALNLERDKVEAGLERTLKMLEELRRTNEHILANAKEIQAGWERAQVEMMTKRAALEADLEKSFQQQRDLKMAHQRDMAALDAAHKQHAQEALALIVQAHGILAT